MNRRGQYSIIAALLVSAILITTFVVTYSMIRENPISDQPQTFSAVDETNFAIKQILGFIVGYYGSVLEVTGNSTDAYSRTLNYTYEGLEQIANIRPEWGISISLIPPLQVGTYWYRNESYSTGQMRVTYNLTKLGVSGIVYQPTCKLGVQVVRNATSGQAYLNVTQDDSGPALNLRSQNFMFYNYTATSVWAPVNPSTEPAFENSIYSMGLPQGIDPQSYVIEVQDQRGIKVIASSANQYTITPTWNPTFTPTNSTIVIELLQNGTMRWLGQPLQLVPGNHTLPIPPIPVKAFRVNQTIDGANRQVPFQIEDWGAEYHIPLALTSNASLFNSRNMMVFLITPNVSKVTIWWNGSDQATQTSFAIYSPSTSPFKNDDQNNGFLSNGILNLTITRQTMGPNSVLTVTSKVGNMNSTAQFTRINNEQSHYGSDVTYVIHHGIVRDIVQTEPEWKGGAGGNENSCTCPDLYAHIVITLPANATYLTYTSRIIFLNSTQPTRKLSDLCVLSLNATGIPTANRYQLTENGTQLPTGTQVSTNTGIFYNYTGAEWAHHWSQTANISALNPKRGTGVMFNNNTNLQIYCFDNQTSKTGGLNVTSGDKTIELMPVKRYQTVDFHSQLLDLTWTCVIVTFDNSTPIYTETAGIKSGLWITVEYPPVLTITAEN
ncbi:MAG: hypothetical protein WBV70_03905 [Candidatus Bathyarchaeia archaeon]